MVHIVKCCLEMASYQQLYSIKHCLQKIYQIFLTTIMSHYKCIRCLNILTLFMLRVLYYAWFSIYLAFHVSMISIGRLLAIGIV